MEVEGQGLKSMYLTERGHEKNTSQLEVLQNLHQESLDLSGVMRLFSVQCMF